MHLSIHSLILSSICMYMFTSVSLCVFFNANWGTASVHDPRYISWSSLLSSLSQKDLLFNSMDGLLYFLMGSTLETWQKTVKVKLLSILFPWTVSHLLLKCIKLKKWIIWIEIATHFMPFPNLYKTFTIA